MLYVQYKQLVADNINKGTLFINIISSFMVWEW